MLYIRTRKSIWQIGENTVCMIIEIDYLNMWVYCSIDAFLYSQALIFYNIDKGKGLWSLVNVFDLSRHLTGFRMQFMKSLLMLLIVPSLTGVNSMMSLFVWDTPYIICTTNHGKTFPCIIKSNGKASSWIASWRLRWYVKIMMVHVNSCTMGYQKFLNRLGVQEVTLQLG